MKIRSDSPFAKISEEQIEFLLEAEKEMTLGELTKRLEAGKPPIVCSAPALKRFLRRVKMERLLEETEDAGEAMDGLVELGKNGRMRDGAIEATRQKVHAHMLDTTDTKTLLRIFRTLREEKMKDRMLALEERKAAAAEENAKAHLKLLEWQKAESAVRLLPGLRELLSDAATPLEARVTRALDYLARGGGLLLGGKTAGTEKVAPEEK